MMNLTNSFVFRTSHPLIFLFYLEDGTISHIVYFNSKLFFYDFSEENLLKLPEGVKEKIIEYAIRVLDVQPTFSECAILYRGGLDDKSGEEQFCF